MCLVIYNLKLINKHLWRFVLSDLWPETHPQTSLKTSWPMTWNSPTNIPEKLVTYDLKLTHKHPWRLATLQPLRRDDHHPPRHPSKELDCAPNLPTARWVYWCPWFMAVLVALWVSEWVSERASEYECECMCNLLTTEMTVLHQRERQSCMSRGSTFCHEKQRETDRKREYRVSREWKNAPHHTKPHD